MHSAFKSSCIYVSELDVHFPELTVGQTLSFAASTRDENPESNTGIRAASMFRLDGAYDTKVGNAMIRGISGGEKRRTSIAEAFIGRAQFQCWDNSTRGLDSFTARRVIDLLRESTSSHQSTVAVSLYQASEAMYKVSVAPYLHLLLVRLKRRQNFDKVILLYKGRQIYFGPIESAASYFISLGFVRPERATTADFLTSMTNPSERLVADGYSNRAPRTSDDFARAWKQSKEAVTLLAEIEAFTSANHTKDTNDILRYMPR
jgi:ABC-type multidrug transport system ATPase subunit